jgi:hypothetical protein
MATTVSNGTLKVTITEQCYLNGKNQGGSQTFTVSDVDEISKRIVTVTTTEASIATFSPTLIGQGLYVLGNVRYMRFTNLDDENFITLTFRNEDNDEVAIKLDAGQFFIWNSDNVNGLNDVFNATEAAGVNTTLGNLENIQADADSDSCDLEMIIVST